MRRTAGIVIATAALVGGLAAPAVAAADPGPAVGTASNSPGVLSGNVLQIPVHIPVNVCGNTIDVVGLLNPAFADTCLND
jgi:hypothetical protein